MYQLFSFLNQYKLSLYKILCAISLMLIFVKPTYGFITFACSIVLLAYSKQIMEFFEQEKN